MTKVTNYDVKSDIINTDKSEEYKASAVHL